MFGSVYHVGAVYIWEDIEGGGDMIEIPKIRNIQHRAMFMAKLEWAANYGKTNYERKEAKSALHKIRKNGGLRICHTEG